LDGGRRLKKRTQKGEKRKKIREWGNVRKKIETKKDALNKMR
jgi:hypothetical protein